MSRFTLQSVCKALIYGIALNELGRDVVHTWVLQRIFWTLYATCIDTWGWSPLAEGLMTWLLITISSLTILWYNINREYSIHHICPGECRCHTDNLSAAKADQTWAVHGREVWLHPELFHQVAALLHSSYSTSSAYRMAGGGSIGFNNSVFLAEREHADRNFAISYQLKVILNISIPATSVWTSSHYLLKHILSTFQFPPREFLIHGGKVKINPFHMKLLNYSLLAICPITDRKSYFPLNYGKSQQLWPDQS